ncbi:MAG: BREX-3 system P-loop-containing protein BrxF [Roseovarius sp.]|nr:BREX-3 system P-loop-containing protein BrxF [Roseovarius sp.]
MIEALERVVDDLAVVNSKLLLLIGAPNSGKSDLLRQLAGRRKLHILNIGAALGRELLTIPSPRRHLQAADLLKGLADEFSREGLLLMDNLEFLFDQELKLSPLDLLRRHPQARRVVAAWPGKLTDNRLSYATTGHPEYQDYSCDGVVPFRVN